MRGRERRGEGERGWMRGRERRGEGERGWMRGERGGVRGREEG